MYNCCNCMGYHQADLDWLIAQIKTAFNNYETIEKSWEETKTYIDNYFANLNVSEEVAAKLDKMVEDGTFDTIINQTIFNELNTELATLKTNYDTLTSSLTTVTSTLSDLVTDVNGFHKYVYLLEDWGGAADGTTNNSTAYSTILADLGDNNGVLWLKNGTYLFSSTIAIPDNLTIVGTGGKFSMASGATCAISGEIKAIKSELFTGDGTYTIGTDKNPVGYPEWFNDDVQATIDHFANVEFGLRDYAVEGDLTINKSHFSMYGQNEAGIHKTAYPQARLLMRSGTIYVGNEEATSTSYFNWSVAIRNLYISVAGAVNAMEIREASLFEMSDCYVYVGSTGNGIRIWDTVQPHFKNCHIQCINSTVNPFYGFYLYDNGSPRFAGSNASIRIEDCTVSNTSDSSGTRGRAFGLAVYGAASDIFLNGFETSNCTCGIYMIDNHNYTSNSRFQDIIIRGCVLDNCSSYPFYFSNIDVTGGVITVSDCYCSVADDTPYSIFFVTNCACRFLITGLQIIGKSNSLAFQFTSSTDCAALIQAFVRDCTALINSSFTHAQGYILTDSSITELTYTV